MNCYVFESADGLTMLDCGVTTDDGLAAITDGLAAVGGQLTTLIGSHLHVDHMAAAETLVNETGARWMMHESVVDDIEPYNDWGLRAAALAAIAQAHGAPTDFVHGLKTSWDRPSWYGTAIEPTDPLSDGDRIVIGPDRSLEVMYTPGHQRNHICLVDSRTGLLFSGDHVLPRISPFVPYTGPDQDHLGDYLASIDRIVNLDVSMTLPAHGSDIERGSDRANQIALHHARRLDDMAACLDEGPASAWQVMESSFRPNLNLLQQRLAIQETLAHLEHLSRMGRVRQIGSPASWQFERVRR